MQPLVTALERDIGLDVESVGTRVLEAAIKRRVAALGCELPRYLQRGWQAPGELDALIDEVVVPETWFFRDRLPFALVAARAAAFVHRGVLRPFRVLSMPCATGEEAYSAVIAMLEAGVPRARFRVDAYDVSQRNIQIAVAGTYGKASVRGAPPAVLAQYLEHGEGRMTVVPAVRAAVRFARANVLATGFLAGEPRFDVVMCRNLMIYLTAAARAKVIALLERCLHADGIVITGHADALDRLAPQFRPTADAGAFAFARRVAATAGSEPTAESRIPPVPLAPLAPPAPVILRPPSLAPVIPPPPADPLVTATALADRGLLEDARALCEQLVSAGPPSAAAYTLLGVIQQGRRDRAAAERAFTQALYVDPQHLDALVHLSLLLRARGQLAAAEQLARRADKARAR